MNFRGHKQAREKRVGMVLLDSLLAVMVFALAITGIILWMQQLAETSNSYGFDTLVQRELENAVREAKLRPVADMNREWFDESLGTTFRTEVEPLEVATGEGNRLGDLYQLRVTASYAYGEQVMDEVAEVYLYKPE